MTMLAANISVHGVTKISARTVQGGDCSGHITIEFEGDSWEKRGSR